MNDAVKIHEELRGKYQISLPIEVTEENLKFLYTPGVAQVSKLCAQNQQDTFKYTRRWNSIAVVSDGSAVLGLGNIGPYGALPVMEGKAMLFKAFGDLDAIALCIHTQEVDEIVKFVKNIEPTFGGINLEDISAPRCFEVLEKLNEIMEIPVFHDDQQGTAVVVLAGLLNALKVVEKRIEDVKIVVNGIGAAGYNIVKFLLQLGAKNIIACDRYGRITKENALHKYHKEIAILTNHSNISEDLHSALKDADVFIGVSKGDILSGEDIRSMANNSIVFALANPTPEIKPEIAYENGAFIVATGRSDYPNQVNNLLAFPGIMKGAVEKQKKITTEMLLKAVYALSKSCEPDRYNILPKATDRNAHKNVYKAVIE